MLHILLVHCIPNEQEARDAGDSANTSNRGAERYRKESKPQPNSFWDVYGHCMFYTSWIKFTVSRESMTRSR